MNFYMFKKTTVKKAFLFLFLNIFALILLYTTIYGNFFYMRLALVEAYSKISNVYNNKLNIIDYGYDNKNNLYVVNIKDNYGLESKFIYDPIENKITDHYQKDYNAYYKSLMIGKIINILNGDAELTKYLDTVYVDIGSSDLRIGIIGEGFEYNEPINITITLTKVHQKEKFAEYIYLINDYLHELNYSKAVIYSSYNNGFYYFTLNNGLLPVNYLNIVNQIKFTSHA